MNREPTVCIICGKLGTGAWTITHGPRVAIADLCAEHTEPLVAILERAEARPRTGKKGVSKVQRSRRVSSFEPLDWTPPS